MPTWSTIGFCDGCGDAFQRSFISGGDKVPVIARCVEQTFTGKRNICRIVHQRALFNAKQPGEGEYQKNQAGRLRKIGRRKAVDDDITNQRG